MLWCFDTAKQAQESWAQSLGPEPLDTFVGEYAVFGDGAFGDGEPSRALEGQPSVESQCTTGSVSSPTVESVSSPPFLTVEGLAASLQRKTKAAIKTVLMDNAVVVGCGNIYASEVLFAARIHPDRPASKLSDAEVRSVVEAIRRTLQAAIEAGGTSFRSYVDGRGEKGGFQEQLQVYGREGQLCLRCKRRKIQAIVQAGRSTTFCPNGRCQKK